MLAIAVWVTLTTPSPVDSLLLARNGKIAAAVGGDHKLYIWSLPDAALLRTVDITPNAIALTAISDDGRWVMISDYNGEVAVWETAAGQSQFITHYDHYLTAAAFSRDSQHLAIAPGAAPVRIIDVASQRLLSTLEPAPFTGAIAFSRDGQRIAMALDDGVRVFDVSSGKSISHNRDFLMEPLTLDFTSDAKQVTAGGADKLVLLIDAATGKTIRRTTKSEQAVVCVEVSPDGKHLAAGTLNADNIRLPAPVVICEIPSLQKETEWMPPSGLVLGTWTSDGHYIAATATREAVRLWRVH